MSCHNPADKNENIKKVNINNKILVMKILFFINKITLVF